MQFRRRGTRDIHRCECRVICAGDIERGDRLNITDVQCAHREQVARIRVARRLALNLQSVVARIEYIQRGEGRAGECVRVRGRHHSRTRGIQRRVRRGETAIDVDAQVLARVADNA